MAAACGGGDEGGEQTAFVTVREADYRFLAPSAWRVDRRGREVIASDGAAAVSVTVFRLTRPYRPALWPRVVRELDLVAGRLADDLGAQVTSRATAVIDGRRARVYAFEGARDDTRRIAFLLHGRREFQLLCRWSGDDPGRGEEACRRLLRGFRIS